VNDDLNISLPRGEPPDAELLKRISVQMESVASRSSFAFERHSLDDQSLFIRDHFVRLSRSGQV
jgi:hypothetical protein